MAYVYSKYPELSNLNVKWMYMSRDPNFKITRPMFDMILNELTKYGRLRYTQDEINYLATIIDPQFAYSLRNYRPKVECIKLNYNDDLELSFEGNIIDMTFLETPIMAIICECHNRLLPDTDILARKHIERIKGIHCTFPFADFGFRRRFSYSNQVEALRILKDMPNFMGTSNVYLAMSMNLKPIGTVAHEYFMMGQVLYPLDTINSRMIDMWKQYLPLNAVLTDTLTTDKFLEEVDVTSLDGFRHDSGDPYEWFEKIAAKLNGETRDKNFIFSNSLSFDEAQEIYNKLSSRGKISFGIGGAICSAVETNIVIKPVEVNGQTVTKVSDCIGKRINNKLLYVIDLQNDFNSAQLQERIQSIYDYIINNRAKYIDVFYTQDTHDPLNYSEPFPIHCVEGTYGWQFVDLIDRIPNKHVIRKSAYAMSPSSLIIPRWVTQIDIIGTATEYCVLANYRLIKSKYPNINVNVIPEYCVGFNHDDALHALLEIYGANDTFVKYLYSPIIKSMLRPEMRNNEFCMIMNQILDSWKTANDTEFNPYLCCDRIIIDGDTSKLPSHRFDPENPSEYHVIDSIVVRHIVNGVEDKSFQPFKATNYTRSISDFYEYVKSSDEYKYYFIWNGDDIVTRLD